MHAYILLNLDTKLYTYIYVHVHFKPGHQRMINSLEIFVPVNSVYTIILICCYCFYVSWNDCNINAVKYIQIDCFCKNNKPILMKILNK